MVYNMHHINDVTESSQHPDRVGSIFNPLLQMRSLKYKNLSASPNTLKGNRIEQSKICHFGIRIVLS